MAARGSASSELFGEYGAASRSDGRPPRGCPERAPAAIGNRRTCVDFLRCVLAIVTPSFLTPPHSRLQLRRPLALLLAAALLTACGSGGDGDVMRGRGLEVESMSPAAQAQVYAAAAAGSFDIGPSLTLLVDRRMLPRDGGYTSIALLPDDVVAAMLRTSAFSGTCEPEAAESKEKSPRCTASTPGYAVRVSPIFAAAGDTLLVYEATDRYDTQRTGTHQRFHMEEAYKLVRRGSRWIVATKARVLAP